MFVGRDQEGDPFKEERQVGHVENIRENCIFRFLVRKPEHERMLVKYSPECEINLDLNKCSGLVWHRIETN